MSLARKELVKVAAEGRKSLNARTKKLRADGKYHLRRVNANETKSKTGIVCTIDHTLNFFIPVKISDFRNQAKIVAEQNTGREKFN